MENTPNEEQIHAHFEKELAKLNLTEAERHEIREAVSMFADQVLDHYFDQLNDS
jgi:demethoxyubiquinone hydroxylase (CLK1/Coq7/Cat5 family)